MKIGELGSYPHPHIPVYVGLNSGTIFIEVPAPSQESDWSCICL